MNYLVKLFSIWIVLIFIKDSGPVLTSLLAVKLDHHYSGVVNLSTEFKSSSKFFSRFGHGPTKGGITADLYHMFLARHWDIHNNLYRVIVDFTVMVLAIGKIKRVISNDLTNGQFGTEWFIQSKPGERNELIMIPIPKPKFFDRKIPASQTEDEYFIEITTRQTHILRDAIDRVSFIQMF